LRGAVSLISIRFQGKVLVHLAALRAALCLMAGLMRRDSRCFLFGLIAPRLPNQSARKSTKARTRSGIGAAGSETYNGIGEMQCAEGFRRGHFQQTARLLLALRNGGFLLAHFREQALAPNR
jgi:hypothetical protein